MATMERCVSHSILWGMNMCTIHTLHGRRVQELQKVSFLLQQLLVDAFIPRKRHKPQKVSKRFETPNLGREAKSGGALAFFLQLFNHVNRQSFKQGKAWTSAPCNFAP